MVKTTGKKKTRPHGAQEWSVKTVNCCTGCSHDCRYCYAKSMAVRFKQVKSEDWHKEVIREDDVYKPHKKYPGQVMFPSSHDITETNRGACENVIDRLIDAGNKVLIVTKPNITSIENLCALFNSYRDSILYRFTIGARDDCILSYWEPNAPCYAERKKCLMYAFGCGFQTSVSIEPMLDSKDIDALIEELSPYVTDAIWVGKMNHLGRLEKHADPILKRAINDLANSQTDDILKQIYDRHKGNPKIKWKKEIKKVVGLPIADRDGLDM